MERCLFHCFLELSKNWLYHLNKVDAQNLGHRESFLFPVINLVNSMLIEEGERTIYKNSEVRRWSKSPTSRDRRDRRSYLGSVSIETITRACSRWHEIKFVSNKLPLTWRMTSIARVGLRSPVIIVIIAIKRLVAPTVNYYSQAQFPGMFLLFVAWNKFTDTYTLFARKKTPSLDASCALLMVHYKYKTFCAHARIVCVCTCACVGTHECMYTS